MIALKREQPADDLTTALIAAEEEGDRLSHDELIGMLFLMLIAGHETTVNLIGNGVLLLLEHPDQLAKFKADPGLVDGVIAETLRYTTPVQQVAPRIAKEAVEMNGNIILLGESVALFVAAANRDPRMFENPNSFDIARQPNKHLGFGYGAHYCLGAPLARMEGQIAFPMLFARFPEMQLAIPSSDIIWRDAIALRGLKNFPIRLTGD